MKFIRVRNTRCMNVKLKSSKTKFDTPALQWNSLGLGHRSVFMNFIRARGYQVLNEISLWLFLYVRTHQVGRVRTCFNRKRCCFENGFSSTSLRKAFFKMNHRKCRIVDFEEYFWGTSRQFHASILGGACRSVRSCPSPIRSFDLTLNDAPALRAGHNLGSPNTAGAPRPLWELFRLGDKRSR